MLIQTLKTPSTVAMTIVRSCESIFDYNSKEQKIILKKFNYNFKKRYSINALSSEGKHCKAEIARIAP